jgi:hypothetical protein
MVKRIKPCGKTKQVCAQLSTINHFLCQIMFIKDFILFLKHNKRPNLTSYLHPQVKLIDRRLTRVSPTHHWVWIHYLYEIPRLHNGLYQWAITPRVLLGVFSVLDKSVKR